MLLSFIFFSKKHPEAIDWRQQLIAVDVLDSEDEAEDGSIDHDDAALDEDDGSGLVGAGVTEYVGDMQKSSKYSFFSSYMLKNYHLITQGFRNNRTAQ